MSYIFEGVFDSVDKCQEYCKLRSSRAHFPAGIWRRKQISYLNQASQSLKLRHASLMKVMSLNSYPSTIIDYGAGSGWTSQLVRQQMGEVTYIAVELPETINFFSKINGSIKWMEKSEVLRSKLSSPIILYANSALQYRDALPGFLEIIEEHNPEMVLIDDLPISAKKEFWTAQNYYGFFTPYKFFEESQIKLLISQYGYVLSLEETFPIDTIADKWKYSISPTSIIRNGPVTLNIPRTFCWKKIRTPVSKN